MYKWFFIFSVLFFSKTTFSQINGCDAEGVSSDHGGFCDGNPILLDTVFFSLGDTVVFNYGFSGNTCPFIDSSRVYLNGVSVFSQGAIQSNSFNATSLGTYSFEWYSTSSPTPRTCNIELVDSNITSVTPIENKNPYRIYPNPNNGKFNILFEKDIPAKGKIEILNFSGQTILRQNVTENSVLVDLTNYSKGMYILKIHTDNEIIIEKIIYR